MQLRRITDFVILYEIGIISCFIEDIMEMIEAENCKLKETWPQNI
jgi:hypothetical protein